MMMMMIDDDDDEEEEEDDEEEEEDSVRDSESDDLIKTMAIILLSFSKHHQRCVRRSLNVLRPWQLESQHFSAHNLRDETHV